MGAPAPVWCARMNQQQDPENMPPAWSAEEAAAEVGRIVPRFERIVIRHLTSARAMGIPLDPPDLGRVLAALEAEASGEPPVELHEDEVKRFALESLLEEMRDESRNIFLAQSVDAETTRYAPLPRPFWRACLAELRRRCRV